ncbi:hypothetical protein PAXRUDRAFT_226835 [Paxillus rubicundulus Ve08.2h10]|uniref:Uncharacterized protein n=1 Tax=Paxillus rubicundulus Ve08.2h10 TaxID=930991 RepID=A0A0D0E160_9AGAM|nr:hypothetical protein PAXRUDRAFT_226835 [Paxillus rubicundulus Ve08.2h10]
MLCVSDKSGRFYLELEEVPSGIGHTATAFPWYLALTVSSRFGQRWETDVPALAHLTAPVLTARLYPAQPCPFQGSVQ